MKYRIVKKADWHFEIQYRDLFRWRTARVFKTLKDARQHIDTQAAYDAPGVVIEEGTV